MIGVDIYDDKFFRPERALSSIVANTDGKKTELNNQLIELRAELNRVKAYLMDELDKVNADAEKLRAFNVSRC